MHLVRSGRCASLTIVDRENKPSGASLVAAGLMHPFTPRGKVLYKGLEGHKASLEMLELVQQTVPLVKIFDASKSILRPCLDEKDWLFWRQAAETFPQWLEEVPEHAASSSTNCGWFGVVRIKKTILVDTPKYLDALVATIRSNQMGCPVEWIKQEVDAQGLEDLASRFDVVVCANGAGVYKSWSCGSSGGSLVKNLKFVRGQNVFIKGDLSHALLSGEYIVPMSDGETLLCGATHEYSSLDEPANISNATVLLKEQISKLYPPFAGSKPFECNAGVRVVNQRTQFGKLPVLARHPLLNNTWLMTALGSRGLIHHALISEYLVKAVLNDDEREIPVELLAAKNI